MQKRVVIDENSQFRTRGARVLEVQWTDFSFEVIVRPRASGELALDGLRIVRSSTNGGTRQPLLIEGWVMPSACYGHVTDVSDSRLP
jgi:hypothetical protein